MLERRAIRVLGIPLALLAVVMFATAAGCLWHHHDQTSNLTCQICHLGHQLFQQPLASQVMSAPTIVGSSPTPEDSISYAGTICRRTLTRAPPSA